MRASFASCIFVSASIVMGAAAAACSGGDDGASACSEACADASSDQRVADSPTLPGESARREHATSSANMQATAMRFAAIRR
jgi:hypothetical protein